jgi:hypothetical protein
MFEQPKLIGRLFGSLRSELAHADKRLRIGKLTEVAHDRRSSDWTIGHHHQSTMTTDG